MASTISEDNETALKDELKGNQCKFLRNLIFSLLNDGNSPSTPDSDTSGHLAGREADEDFLEVEDAKDDMFTRIQKMLNDIILLPDTNDACALDFPKFVIGQNEASYNKHALKVINQGSKFQAFLFERIMVSLGSTKYNKHSGIVLADVLLQEIGTDKYSIVHVKKEDCKNFENHCFEIMYSARYLGEIIDKQHNLTDAFAVRFVQDFYKRHMHNIPPKSKSCYFKSLSFKKSENVQSLFKKFTEKIQTNKSYVSNVKFKRHCDELIISINERDVLKQFEIHLQVWVKCLDCCTDLLLKATKLSPAKKKQLIVKFLPEMINLLDSHQLITGNDVIKQEDRKNFSLVMAIITNKREFTRQQLLALDIVFNIVLEQGFKFKIMFIPQAEKSLDIVQTNTYQILYKKPDGDKEKCNVTGHSSLKDVEIIEVNDKEIL